MAFTNPSSGATINTGNLEKKLDELNEKLDNITKMTEEILGNSRDQVVTSKLGSLEENKDVVTNIEVEPVSFDDIDTSVPLETSISNEITYFDDTMIPSMAEASEGMQRILPLDVNSLNNISSKTNNLNNNENNEEVSPIRL